jgi:type IV pilus assembly protein PilP
VFGIILFFLPSISQGQVNTVRPAESIKVPSMPELSKPSQHTESGPPPEQQPVKTEEAVMSLGAAGSYDPSGRRDPFAPIIESGTTGQSDTALPPLQRVGLTELNLIGIVWGAYGYTAMVQTPDGKGYSIRRGTRVGPNNGMVSSITERGIIVQERFTDVYGNKQEREYVKLLHAKEGIE